MKKRICGILLALALLAANQTALASRLTVFGEVAVPPEIAAMTAEEPTIFVVVQSENWVIANPYGMEVERDGVVSREEIVSPTVVLENQSGIPVRVDVQATAEAVAGSGVVFVQTPPAQDETEKNVFLYAEFQPIEDAGSEAVWSGSFIDGADQILVTDAERTKEGVVTLKAAGMPYSAGAMRVFGAVAHSPSEAWGGSDGFNVNFVFSFAAADELLPEIPVMAPEEETPVAEAPGEEIPDETIPDETIPETDAPVD